MIKKLLLALFFMVVSGTSAFAQALTPACSNPPPNYGVVWTSGQWTACLSSFQAYLGYVPLNRAGGSMSGQLQLQTSATTNAPLNFPPGSAPLSPNNGDAWFTAAGLYYRASGSTVGPLVGNGNLNLIVGTTPITSGTNGYIEYNNSGILGELATTGSGSVVRASTPTLTTPVLGVATGTSIALGGATIGSNALAVTGTSAFSTTASFGTASTDYVQASGGGSGGTVTTNGGTLTLSSGGGTTNLADATVKLGNAGYASCGLLITNSSNNVVCSSLPASGLTFNDNVTTSTAASVSNLYCMNTASGALTLTLPASPTVGQKVAFMDCGGNFGLHNLTIANNGNQIMYVSGNMVVSTPYASGIFIWSVGLTSWILSPS